MIDTLFFFFLASIAPSKQKEIAASGFRALIAGTVACFMTACVAGTVPPFGDHCVAACRQDRHSQAAPLSLLSGFARIKCQYVMKGS